MPTPKVFYGLLFVVLVRLARHRTRSLKEWSACAGIALLQIIVVFGLKAWLVPNETLWLQQPYLLRLGWVFGLIWLNQYFLVNRRWGLDMEERFVQLSKAARVKKAAQVYLLIGAILLFFVVTVMFVPAR